MRAVLEIHRGSKSGRWNVARGRKMLARNLTWRHAMERYELEKAAQPEAKRKADPKWANLKPAIIDDIRPHFNLSAGEPVGSRRDLKELCKRRGLRPVDPTLATDDGIRTENERLKKNNAHRLRNPKVTLMDTFKEEYDHGR